MFSIGSLERVNKCTLMTTLKISKKSTKKLGIFKKKPHLVQKQVLTLKK